MNAENFSIEALLRMKHSPVKNYVIPGLTSSLIGNPSSAGTIRLFECSRDHQESITPHSHRFSFQCWVLRGSVRNRIWTELEYPDTDGDQFCASSLEYSGEFGKYEKKDEHLGRWRYEDALYRAGECYSMRSDEVHSIFFSRGAIILFFEGPTESNKSVILEPYVDGAVVPTFKVEPWMFKKDQS
jgi:hypothetical protein